MLNTPSLHKSNNELKISSSTIPFIRSVRLLLFRFFFFDFFFLKYMSRVKPRARELGFPGLRCWRERARERELGIMIPGKQKILHDTCMIPIYLGDLGIFLGDSPSRSPPVRSHRRSTSTVLVE